MDEVAQLFNIQPGALRFMATYPNGQVLYIFHEPVEQNPSPPWYDWNNTEEA
jgi:hypothetical protein